MKSFKKLLTASVLATAAISAQASIILPSTGDSELIAILYNVANENSLIVDLGVTISTFNVANNQSFNLAASPYYNQFIAAAGTNTIAFQVFGADSNGPASGVIGSKKLYLTSASGGTLPNGTNANVSTRAGIASTFLATINGALTGTVPTYFSNHTLVADGSSLDTTAGTTTSYSSFGPGVTGPAGAATVNIGSRAEFFTVTTGPGTANGQAVVTDFFSDTETADNLGGYFTVNKATGSLDYFGAPTTVVINPIPEASEWAMMLSGLGMLGLMVRRRRNNV
jgi:hypothetical protein